VPSGAIRRGPSGSGGEANFLFLEASPASPILGNFVCGPQNNKKKIINICHAKNITRFVLLAKKQPLQKRKKMHLFLPSIFLIAIIPRAAVALLYYDPALWTPLLTFVPAAPPLAVFAGSATMQWARGSVAGFRIIALDNADDDGDAAADRHGCRNAVASYSAAIAAAGPAPPGITSTWLLMDFSECSYMHRAVACSQVAGCGGIIVAQDIFAITGYLGIDSCDLTGNARCDLIRDPGVPPVMEIYGPQRYQLGAPWNREVTLAEFVREIQTPTSFFVFDPAFTDYNDYDGWLNSLGTQVGSFISLMPILILTFVPLVLTIVRLWRSRRGLSVGGLSGIRGDAQSGPNFVYICGALLLETYALACRCAVLNWIFNSTVAFPQQLNAGLNFSALVANSLAVYLVALHERSVFPFPRVLPFFFGVIGTALLGIMAVFVMDMGWRSAQWKQAHGMARAEMIALWTCVLAFYVPWMVAAASEVWAATKWTVYNSPPLGETRGARRILFVNAALGRDYHFTMFFRAVFVLGTWAIFMGTFLGVRPITPDMISLYIELFRFVAAYLSYLNAGTCSAVVQRLYPAAAERRESSAEHASSFF
jgi:hypothetical protein